MRKYIDDVFVVTSYYNNIKSLEVSIRSIADNVDVLIVDDGSDDFNSG